MASTSHRLAS